MGEGPLSLGALIWMVIAFLIELLARNLHQFSPPAPRTLLLLRYKLSLCAPQWEKCAWQNKKLIACTLAIIAAMGRKCKSVFGIWLGSLFSLSLWFCSDCLLQYKVASPPRCRHRANASVVNNDDTHNWGKSAPQIITCSPCLGYRDLSRRDLYIFDYNQCW
jgi:hypothetical protein